MADTIFLESFETDGNGTRYITSVPEFSDGSGDFFTRTDGSNISSFYQVSDFDGSFYFAAMDIDGEVASSQQTLTFSNIDITNYTNLNFSALFAEDDDGVNQDWDDTDSFIVEYQIDGGGFQNLFAIAEIDDGDAFNQEPGVDTDFDGVADGSAITSTFAEFTSAIAETGSSLDLLFTFDLDSGDEDIAIDNIQITGDAAAPATPLISEFQPNPIGTDPANVTFELSGTPGTAFLGWLVSIESDPGNPGVVDRVIGLSGNFDANGLLTVNVPDLENPSFTVALLETFTGSTSTDIDTNDDGVPDDLSTFGTVFDAIGVPDSTGDEALLYGADLGGTDFAFTGDEPRLIFREASTGDLYAVNDPDNGQVFDVNGVDVTPLAFNTDPTVGTDTFGAINPTFVGIPGPILAIAPTDADKAEGDSGTTDFTFTVTRSGDTTGATEVDFAVTGDADAADFSGLLPSGTITFAASEVSQTITIGVSGDTDPENNESFTVTLSNATSGATITTATADGTIQNDDGVAITKIHAIQGNTSTQQAGGEHDDVSPLDGQSVTIQGIVTAVFPELDGFFIQEEDADADTDSATSEGIFVFTGSAPTVSEGNLVTVTGAVDEFFGMTQIDNDNGDFSVTINDAGDNLNLVSPGIVDIPVTGDIDDFYEQYEGMLVQFSDKLFVSEYFQLARFGQIVLTEGERPYQYTHVDETPTAAEFQQFEEDLARRQIILDDGNNEQNAPLPDGTIFHPQPDGFGVGTQGEDFFRGGDSISNLTGVLHWSFAGSSDTDAWRIRPTEANPVEFTVENPRPAGPEDVGGNIQVASFNVLNYFTTLDAGSNQTGPNNDLDPRGANSTEELEQQTTKLVEALAQMDADVVALSELENNNDVALDALVAALNNVVGEGTYAAISTGFAGDDAITAGIIYKPGVVEPQGSVAVLEDPAFLDPNNTGEQRNRPAIAQSFEVIDPNNPDFGESFSVISNHFKSKGFSGATGSDVDQGDGQGNWNDTRTQAAEYLVNTWIPQLISQGFDEDFLITGDLNAYRFEDPITALKNAGYTDLIKEFQGDDAYSFVFDSKLGYLDHALSSASLTPQVTGVTEWHVNADEVNVFDYNNTVQDGNERSFEAKPSGNTLYEPNAFRNSDHDPLIVGLDLFTPANIIFVDENNIIVGNAFGAGTTYEGNLFSSTDGTANPDDIIEGTPGDDNIWAGEEGNDVINAGDGNNTIGIGTGDSEVTAGSGDDFIYSIAGGGGTNVIDLGEGNDQAWLESGDNNITAGAGNNTLGIGTGSDTVTTGDGDDFVYSINGGGGTNVLDLGNGTNTVWVENGNYNITTGSGDDSIGLGTGNDIINAGDGNNIIYVLDAATAGNKVITTGSGDDYIATGAGNDIINAGTGTDFVVGGDGSDTFLLNTNSDSLIIADFDPTEGDVLDISAIGLTFSDLEFVTLSASDRTLVFNDDDLLAELQGFTETLTSDNVNDVSIT